MEVKNKIIFVKFISNRQTYVCPLRGVRNYLHFQSVKLKIRNCFGCILQTKKRVLYYLYANAGASIGYKKDGLSYQKTIVLVKIIQTITIQHLDNKNIQL